MEMCVSYRELVCYRKII